MKNARLGFGFAAIGACVALSACVGTPLGGTVKKEYKKTVVSGQASKLQGTVLIKEDCTFLSYPYLAVIDPPAHGKVDISHGEVHPSFAAGSPVYSCRNMPFQGNIITYTSDPGYVGTDRFTLRLAGLHVREIDDETVTVNVVR